MTTTANAHQFAAWNGDSGQRWVGTAHCRDAVLAPIADLLHDYATVTAGERVLDIGCGCGAATLAAAAAAGPAGHAVGVDSSAPMLGVARRRGHRLQQRRVPTGGRPDRPARRALRRGNQPVRDHVLRRPNRRVRQHRLPPRTGRAAVHRHLATARGQRVAHRARRAPRPRQPPRSRQRGSERATSGPREESLIQIDPPTTTALNTRSAEALTMLRPISRARRCAPTASTK